MNLTKEQTEAIGHLMSPAPSPNLTRKASDAKKKLSPDGPELNPPVRPTLYPVYFLAANDKDYKRIATIVRTVDPNVRPVLVRSIDSLRGLKRIRIYAHPGWKAGYKRIADDLVAFCKSKELQIFFLTETKMQQMEKEVEEMEKNKGGDSIDAGNAAGTD